jgi:hypothetical protein
MSSYCKGVIGMPVTIHLIGIPLVLFVGLVIGGVVGFLLGLNAGAKNNEKRNQEVNETK